VQDNHNPPHAHSWIAGGGWHRLKKVWAEASDDKDERGEGTGGKIPALVAGGDGDHRPDATPCDNVGAWRSSCRDQSSIANGATLVLMIFESDELGNSESCVDFWFQLGNWNSSGTIHVTLIDNMPQVKS
jgi:hypothetical protein